MVDEAILLASLLVNRGNVKRVGVAGSLARGKENPSDMDFIIFVDNETAKACHREKMRLLRTGSNKKVPLSEYLTLDDEEWNLFAAVYSGIESQVDIQVVSDNPDEEYIKMVANDNLDPSFLINISNDAFIYDPSVKTFIKRGVFDDKKRQMMEEASFKRLKEILAETDKHYIETVKKSHSHQKRINRIKGKQVEESRSKIEISPRGREIDEEKRQKYLDYISAIDKDPFSEEIWDKVVELAKSEVVYDDGSSAYYFEEETPDNFYEHVSLRQLVDIGNRLREAETREDRNKILMEKNSEGELWYDIILGHVNNKMFEPVVERIASSGVEFEKGLDLGCGSGNSLKMLAPFCEVCTGLDSSQIALDAARQSGLPDNVTLVNGNITKLSFDDGCFDVVTSNGLTCYLTTREIKGFVAEVDRVLERGGSYFETVVTLGGKVLPAFEEEYLSSAKSVLVCLLDRMCSNVNDIGITENTITVLMNQFKQLGYGVQFSGFNENDLGLLEFRKR